MDKHTFVVVAYKESEYLEDCIKSVLHQSIKSRVIVATSTDNAYIRRLCEYYGLELFVKDGESNIADDWNFAASCVETDYFTFAHQDDIYEYDYARCAIEKLDASPRALIYFSDYYEIRGDERVEANANLKIKRVLLFPLRFAFFNQMRFVKRRVISIGNPISCPAVSYARHNIMMPLFAKGFKSNIDWQAWEELSRQSGAFIFDPRILMGHRVHEGSTTTEIIESNMRTLEDLEMLYKFWPRPVAWLINKVYRGAEKSNN